MMSRVLILLALWFAGQATVHPAVDRLLVRKLENIGVEVVHVDNVTASELSPDMWALLTADDLGIERFLIRDPTSRSGTFMFQI